MNRYIPAAFTAPLAALALLATFSSSLLATPAQVFGNNMVLQRDTPVPVWGSAKPETPVKVSFAGQEKSTTADKSGHWQVTLDSLPASAEPRDMVINDGAETVFQNVVVGEVWVCSGQSNMAWTVKQSLDAENEMPAANHPEIRLIGNDLGGKWTVCTPSSVGEFSGVAYFFARDLQAALHVPVGLISVSVGGSNTARWIPRQALKSDKELMDVTISALASSYFRELTTRRANAAKKAAAGQPTPTPSANPRKDWEDFLNWRIGGLYERFIEKTAPFAVRGILWYQAEGNAVDPDTYAQLFPLLVKSWRAAWNNDAMPFLFVQLPNYDTPSAEKWARMREVQTGCLSIPSTGMVVTIDVGDASNLHPRNKRDVGKRAALLARKSVYGEDIVADGPAYASSRVEGDKIRIFFKESSSPLRLSTPASSFVIADKDGNFLPAEARIDGNTLLVWNAEIKEPAAVRYAWTDSPTASLFNDAGLPAAPFRTDDWKYPYLGPVYASYSVEGEKIRLKFTQDSLPLKLQGKTSRDFRIAGADHKFFPAEVAIDGNSLLVWSPDVPAPLAVRYAWGNDELELSLFDTAGQSASPFRTDDWPVEEF